MLFLSITFHMSLFYLTHHSDADIRRYSWETISSILSIFCSLLVFEGFDGVVRYYLHFPGFVVLEIIVDFLHYFAWLLVLQGVIFFISGAHAHPNQVSRWNHDGARAAAHFLAHIAGFAAINAWGDVQQLPFFSETPLRAFGVAALAYVWMLTVAHYTDSWREWQVLQDDGVKDHNEILWDEEVEEAEDDAIGLTVSFLTVQAIRFAICYDLPDKHGHLTTEPCHIKSLKLLGSAGAILPAIVTLGYVRARIPHTDKGTRWGRLVSTFHIISSMTFAFCVLFSIILEVVRHPWLRTEEGVQNEVVIALMVSVIALVAVFILDKLADWDATGPEADRAIITVIMSFGLMVGFAWERCFAAGIEAITERHFSPPGSWRPWVLLGMALATAALILPAWSQYIFHAASECHGHGGSDHRRRSSAMQRTPTPTSNASEGPTPLHAKKDH